MITWIKDTLVRRLSSTHATLIEFVKCLGYGKRAHMFVVSIDCGAFESFSNFLGNPGMEHNLYFKMAAGPEAGYRISLV